ncbi:DNA oxidative demethylase AlkB [Methylotenera sp. G11]|uniref:DNA oxidative demethylase AlkB n=1 Tax=Methylotenera sp. G11 TaxID=1506585 RepID=UPI000648A0FC|nr:DNA oxidative demethylase AlkB [Methylotenera sp. G11]
MDLFEQSRQEEILKDVHLLRGFALPDQNHILADLSAVMMAAPLRQMITPGGLPMSVTTSNCGALGWVSDKNGYRYAARDPKTGTPWPAMPSSFRQLAEQAANTAGFGYFNSDACLINCYRPGAKMGLHQDKDEQDFTQPIVSVSLGIPAMFQMGGFARGDKTLKLPLYHGDVLVWGGESRLRFHGVMPLKPANHPALGECRINLTFRKGG